MGSTTPTFAWPIPAETDTPDVPRDVSALALAIEATLNGSLMGGYIDYVPATATGFSVGNGTVVHRYARIGNLVQVIFNLTGAASGGTSRWTTTSGGVIVALPFAVAPGTSANGSGRGNTANAQLAALVTASGNNLSFYGQDRTAITFVTPGGANGWGGTTAWGTGGYAQATVTYMTSGTAVT